MSSPEFRLEVAQLEERRLGLQEALGETSREYDAACRRLREITMRRLAIVAEIVDCNAELRAAGLEGADCITNMPMPGHLAGPAAGHSPEPHLRLVGDPEGTHE